METLRREHMITTTDLSMVRRAHSEDVFRRRMERLERYIQQISATESLMIRSLRNLHGPEFHDQMGTMTMFMAKECDDDFPEYLMAKVRSFCKALKKAQRVFTDSYEFYDREVSCQLFYNKS